MQEYSTACEIRLMLSSPVLHRFLDGAGLDWDTALNPGIACEFQTCHE